MKKYMNILLVLSCIVVANNVVSMENNNNSSQHNAPLPPALQVQITTLLSNLKERANTAAGCAPTLAAGVLYSEAATRIQETIDHLTEPSTRSTADSVLAALENNLELLKSEHKAPEEKKTDEN